MRLNHKIYETDRYNLQTGESIQHQEKPSQYQIVPAPLNATAPIYLYGGRLILTQNADEVKNARNLNNVFTIVCGLTQNRDNSSNYEAKGVFLPIEDFLDQRQVEMTVQGGAMMDIIVEFRNGKDNTSEIVLMLQERQSMISFELELDGLKLYGLKQYSSDKKALEDIVVRDIKVDNSSRDIETKPVFSCRETSDCSIELRFIEHLKIRVGEMMVISLATKYS